MKTVTLKLESPLCTEEIEIPAELWKRFEEYAKSHKITPEELFPIVVDTFLKKRGK